MNHPLRPAAALPRPIPLGSWRPSRFLWGQVGLHAVAFLVLGIWPHLWPWALAIFLLSHLMVMLSGLWPRSTWMDNAMVRLPESAVLRREVAITIDDGPDPVVTPRVLEILARHGVKASFFCIGARAAQYPALCQQMVAAGHRVENHGQRHPHLISLGGPRRWWREVMEGQQTLQAITGQAPHYYRAVAGLRNVFLGPVLHRAGLRLASWTRRGFDTRECDAQIVLDRLLRQLQAGDVLLLHDGNAARTREGEPVIEVVLPQLLEALKQRELVAVTLVAACREDAPMARSQV